MRRKKLERDLVAEFTRTLRAQGALVYPLIQDERTPPGWPDRLVWHEKWCGLVEVKGPATRAEPHQVELLRRLDEKRRWSAVQLRAPLSESLGREGLWTATRYSCEGPSGDEDFWEGPLGLFLAAMRGPDWHF
jgi:hypothetical protein